MTLRAHPETGPVWTPSRFTVDAARLRGRLGFFRRTFGACCLILLTVFSLSGELAAQPDNPLITEADTEILRRKAIDYNKALGASSLTQADIALLNEMSKAQVLQMSLSSKQRELSDIRERIKRDMNLLAKPAARGAILPQFAQHATTLLKDQPLPVRINACMLLTELNEEPPVIQKQIPAVPFLGVADALIQVLSDPDQHTAVKIIAAKGLMRICRDGKPKVDLRTRIADVMVDQLKTQGSNEWYRRTLIESVSWTSVLFDKTRKPYIIQTLALILIDSQEPWMVRAEAAAGLGRTEMNGEINLPLITYEIVKFTSEMGQQYNRSMANSHWRFTAFRTYTAFQPQENGQMALLVRIKNAPFNTNRALVEDAYSEVLKVVNGILKNPVGAPGKIPDTALQDVQKWLDDHPQSNQTLGPNVPPLRQAN